MLNFPEKYKIVYLEDKKGFIASDHKNKKLLISKDLKLSMTEDGKLRATFQNFRPKINSGFGCSSGKNSDTDCSVIISDPSRFNHCVQKDGIYQLSGANITFDGTNNDDTLILRRFENSKINMGRGNDTIFYRDEVVFNNDIDLGEGSNIFTTKSKTDADKALIKNKITSGKGNDYIYLRNAIGNNIYTGDGNDIVEIDDASQSKFANYFKDNLICTEKGDDTVKISGNFVKFQNNKFYLGKGDDNFSATINPKADAQTEYDYNKRLPEYINASSGVEVYATDGKKGWFEDDVFESNTYSANKILLSDFEAKNVTTKPIPRNQISTETTEATTPAKSVKKTTIEDAKRRYWAGSLGYNLFHSAKSQEAAFKALDDYVNAMVNE